MNKVEQKIESVKVVLENKVVSNYKVGVNGVTEIVIGYGIQDFNYGGSTK